MRWLYTIILLILSNTFMTFAWYGHLKFKDMKWSANLGLVAVILISWGIALFEYILQVPANRLGSKEYGGPYSLMQLKVIQEVISLSVFVAFAWWRLGEPPTWRTALAFILIVAAVAVVRSGPVKSDETALTPPAVLAQ